MECVDSFVAAGSGGYFLFYEELGEGDHLSRIYYVSDRLGSTIRPIASVPEWLVSLWADPTAGLFAATWDGRIFSIIPELRELVECDLLGAIKLAGFDGQPRFLMGEDGLIYVNRGGDWQRLKFRGKPDVYSVARRDKGEFYFAGSGGRVLAYSDGGSVTSVDVPTNVDLHGIAFASPARGAVVGEEGTIILYHDGIWQDASGEMPTLHDVHSFKGRLIASVEDESIVEIDGTGAVRILLDKPGYYFSSNDQVAVTFNAEFCLFFDGDSFTELSFERFPDL